MRPKEVGSDMWGRQSPKLWKLFLQVEMKLLLSRKKEKSVGVRENSTKRGGLEREGGQPLGRGGCIDGVATRQGESTGQRDNADGEE